MKREETLGNEYQNKAADRRWTLIVTLVVLIGLGLRVFKAWTLRYSTEPDSSICALMVKHMVEGRDIPVFFYGQAYMGNTESLVSAALCQLLGLVPTNFMVILGTALVGTFLLPVLYLFGRDAGNRRAGLLAMLFCLVGSDTNFHYAVSPHGAYMTLMVCGLFTVWLACRLANRLAREATIPPLHYLALGLIAGLGWWGTQLVIVFLSTAASLLLLRCRWSLVRIGLPLSLAGFFLGGLPWWVWNATHQLAKFRVQRITRAGDPPQGGTGKLPAAIPPPVGRRQSLPSIELGPDWHMVLFPDPLSFHHRPRTSQGSDRLPVYLPSGRCSPSHVHGLVLRHFALCANQHQPLSAPHRSRSGRYPRRLRRSTARKAPRVVGLGCSSGPDPSPNVHAPQDAGRCRVRAAKMGSRTAVG